MTTKMTWDNFDDDDLWADVDDSNEMFDELCQNSKGSDFYFSLHVTPTDDPLYNDIVDIYITPRVWCDKNGVCDFDREMNIDDLFPDWMDFGQVMEAVWDTAYPVEDVRKELLARGFIESQELFDQIEPHHKNTF